MSFLKGILAGIVKDFLLDIFSWLRNKAVAYFTAKDYIEETDKRVLSVEELQAKAKLEVEELGEVSAETREALRAATRDLVRGPRDQ